MIIRNLNTKFVEFNGKTFRPPQGFILDYADSDLGILSCRSEAGFIRKYKWQEQDREEFVPEKYFVKQGEVVIK